MKLSKKAIDDFKKLYLKKYGVIVSEAEANSIAHRLLIFYRFKYTND